MYTPSFIKERVKCCIPFCELVVKLQYALAILVFVVLAGSLVCGTVAWHYRTHPAAKVCSGDFLSETEGKTTFFQSTKTADGVLCKVKKEQRESRYFQTQLSPTVLSDLSFKVWKAQNKLRINPESFIPYLEKRLKKF